jgi:hypothetical protein
MLKSTHPVFDRLSSGDTVTMHMKAVVKNDNGAYVKFEVVSFELDKVKMRRHPAEVMKDANRFHQEPIV